jgi:hypothetical protein
MANYLVLYGRFVDDKQEGVYLDGVYFGGVADDVAGADMIASNCVNNAKRGTSFPKIIPLDRPDDFPVVVRDTLDRFAKMEASMIEAEDIQRANQDMAKRRRTR